MPPTNAEYAKINIACKELGIDKYQLLSDRYGLSSSKQLKPRQVFDLMAHFKKLGWKPKRGKKSKKKDVAQAQDPMSRKIRALWITMHQQGIVKNPSEKSLVAYVKRIVRVDRLEWCNTQQKSIIIESLKNWQERALLGKATVE